MKTVLYSRDFEPITILDLPLWALERGQRMGVLQVAVVDEPCMVGAKLTEIPDGCDTVRLEFHRVRHGDVVRYWITTPDDVTALRLEPSWLAGQQRMVSAYERRIRGLTKVITGMMAGGLPGH